MSKAFILMIVIVALIIGLRELLLRQAGVPISYDDGPAFWSYKRGLVYKPKCGATVFIGTSRMNYDLDIDTWKKLTGDEPIQLAIAGTGPINVLLNLAEDRNFKGKLVIDGMEEGLLFGDGGTPITYINYYKTISPAQRISFQINQLLESEFVFLDKDNFSLSAELSRLRIPSRKNVWIPPVFPTEFTYTNNNRQHFMTSRMIIDTVLQNQVKEIWNQHHNFFKDTIRISEHSADSIFRLIKTATDKIKSRGGDVLFVKLPSSGPYLMSETRDFPRNKFWDQLLAVTNCPGIHFQDYSAINHFSCPEWSHLSPNDAKLFTAEFVRILKEEKKWIFPKNLLQ